MSHTTFQTFKLSTFQHRAAFILAFCLFQCAPTERKKPDLLRDYERSEFGYDLNFLKKYHSDLVLLEQGDAQVIVLPAYQGRIMTSTANGPRGTSYGWINYELISGGNLKDHMNAFGGEDRFWLGPEGGQFSIYFKKDVPFTFDNWFVPKELDVESFSLVSNSSTEARFEKAMHLKNYSDNDFNLKVTRIIRLLSRDTIQKIVGNELPADLQVVGFESENILTNTGNEEWTKETGALSIWILGMFNAADSARVVIPFKKGEEKQLGKIVTDDYFGTVPPDRLKVRDGFMVLQADGKYRSKIGISPARAFPWLGSYDSVNDLLTIVQLTLHGPDAEYVNSQWALQKEPFNGDVVNSYNDGPIENGEQLGNFYELESSSPAAFLKPGESIKHIQRTMHFQGKPALLDSITRRTLQLKLSAISLR
jgi:hypothetical protein